MRDWKRRIGDLPLVAIGGLTVERAAGVFAAGADIVSVVTDITLNPDPEARVRAWIGGDAMSRYARQIILPEVGAAGQARLAAAHALVVGAGGLGVPVLQYLAGAGVGRITVVDPDVVERGNLHRQTLYGERFLGTIEGRRRRGRPRRPQPRGPRSQPVVGRLDPANAPALVAAGRRRARLRRQLRRELHPLGRLPRRAAARWSAPRRSASAATPAASAAARPSLRAVFPDLPERAATCATAGILGPVVGLLGCLQAQMALAILLGLAPSPLGQLVSFEAAGLRFGGFRFDGAPEPDAPARLPRARGQISRRRLRRRPARRRRGAGAGDPWARRLAVADFGDGGPRPAPGQRAVLVCRSGLRSWQAAAAPARGSGTETSDWSRMATSRDEREPA